MKYLSHTTNIFFIFCVIFMVNVFSIIDSAMVVFGILILLLLFIPRYRKIVSRLLFSKKFAKLSLTFIIFIIWIIFCVLFNGSSDFSFIRTLLHLYIQLIICLMLYSYLAAKKEDKYIHVYILIAFLIQSLFAVIGMLNPGFKVFLLSTKSDLEAEIAMKYGFRGLSLAGSSFFGLAISFGLVIIVLFSRIYRFRTSYIPLFVFTVLIVVAGLSAGRTSAIGLVFAIILFIVNGGLRKKKLKRIVRDIIISIALFGIFVLLFYDSIADKMGHFLGDFQFYISEFFTSSSGGVFQTTSTEHLFSDMFIPVQFRTLLIGDGLYTVESGYYMSTDSGLMRPILYAGVPALLFLLYIQYQIFDFGGMGEKYVSLFIILLLFTMILQIKGEVLGFALIYNSVAFLVSLSLMNKRLSARVRPRKRRPCAKSSQKAIGAAIC